MPENSYDPNARRPELWSRWLWEPKHPTAYEPVEVVEVLWNGEEWWVRTTGPSGRCLNDLSRFWEAVVPDTSPARRKAEARVSAASPLNYVLTHRLP